MWVLNDRKYVNCPNLSYPTPKLYAFSTLDTLRSNLPTKKAFFCFFGFWNQELWGKKTPCGSFTMLYTFCLFSTWVQYIDDPIWRIYFPNGLAAAAWGLWLLRHLACLQRLLGWPVEGFDQRTHLGEEMELNPEKWEFHAVFEALEQKFSYHHFSGGKEAAQSFFLCIYSLKKPCFFSTRQVGEVPTKSQLDQVSLIPNSDA